MLEKIMYQLKEFPDFYTDNYDVYNSIKGDLCKACYDKRSNSFAVHVKNDKKYQTIRLDTLWKREKTEKTTFYKLPDLTGFRTIKGYDDYLIDKKGNVFSLNNFCMRKQKISKNGYYVVNLSKNNQLKWVSVHRLVAQTWLANPNDLPTVDHINRNRLDNRVENLRWASWTLQNENKDKTHTTNQHGRRAVALEKNGVVLFFPTLSEAKRCGFYISKRKYGWQKTCHGYKVIIKEG